MKKQPQITELTRKRLKDAFWSLYTELPIEKISVREIAGRAGYNRGTFYEYFDDVYDLLDQIEEEIIGALSPLVDQPTVIDAESLSHRMEGIVSTVRGYETYAATLLGENGDPAFAHRVKELLAPLVEQTLLAGNPTTGRERELLREFHLSGILAIIGSWLSNPGTMTIEGFTLFFMQAIVWPSSQHAPGSRSDVGRETRGVSRQATA